MRVLIFEDNLMWSSRLKKSVEGLGHEAVMNPGTPEGDAAIINLGSTAYDPKELTRDLHEMGIKVLAHAGHKEKQLRELGREAGCDVLATNSELTFKIEQLLARLA